MDFETRAIHDGQEPDPATGAVTVPIYQTSTYVQEAVGEHKGYDYARVSNPTRTALQLCLASLESAEHGLAFSSGLGAVTTIMHLSSTGDRIVAVNDVYGGVYRMFSQVYEPKGYEFTWLPASEIGGNLAEHLDERTRIVWLETPTNPLLNVIDIRAAAEAAHAAGALVVRDNTFAPPYLPRLPTHPGHTIAAKQMRDFGGMISFMVETEEEAVGLVARTQVFQLAESLGGVESLIEHPARMTHASTADAPFAAPRNLIRLSVGLESAEDLLADLEAALVRSAATAGA